MVYRVKARMFTGKRITTTKYWIKKKGAKEYARKTNIMKPGARALVIKVKKKRRRK